MATIKVQENKDYEIQDIFALLVEQLKEDQFILEIRDKWRIMSIETAKDVLKEIVDEYTGIEVMSSHAEIKGKTVMAYKGKGLYEIEVYGPACDEAIKLMKKVAKKKPPIKKVVEPDSIKFSKMKKLEFEDGVYIVDPCYVYGDREDWDELFVDGVGQTDKVITVKSGKYKYMGYVVSTGGDGEFKITQKKKVLGKVGVDSGLLMIIDARYGGADIEASVEVKDTPDTYPTSDDGVILWGNIEIA